MEKDYLWIIDCMDSCTNEFQLNCCATLIQLFNRKYGDKVNEYEQKLLAQLSKINNP